MTEIPDDETPERDRVELPFDPAEPIPFDIEPGHLSEAQRVAVAAHAHYHSVRGALDMINASGFQASLTGVPDELLSKIEERAQQDDDAEYSLEDSDEQHGEIIEEP